MIEHDLSSSLNALQGINVGKNILSHSVCLRMCRQIHDVLDSEENNEKTLS